MRIAVLERLFDRRPHELEHLGRYAVVERVAVARQHEGGRLEFLHVSTRFMGNSGNGVVLCAVDPV